MSLLRALDDHHGVGADCILAMLRHAREEHPTETDDARAIAGAVMVSRLVHDVRIVRTLLTRGGGHGG